MVMPAGPDAASALTWSAQWPTTMTTCRTPEEALAAGQADADQDPPLDQDQADLVAVILAPSQAAEAA